MRRDLCLTHLTPPTLLMMLCAGVCAGVDTILILEPLGEGQRRTQAGTVCIEHITCITSRHHHQTESEKKKNHTHRLSPSKIRRQTKDVVFRRSLGFASFLLSFAL
ncbi:unnamed protein product [Ectocarpus fasciculatus]